ncbi:TPA: hypothetical protein PTV74_003178 [Clostridium botulinum]|nr:hypothetical protein [Clostridium botulinum]HDK7206333.1 hypothetical protein [Clostridium botulinum]HDK7210069.1 hypothetical protein [Clostridium botulinum]HDK7265518.1 hypothetical protein [Clostridium botulinum]HDK7269366.1 hypothetical protein [Clostridium botulinum]
MKNKKILYLLLISIISIGLSFNVQARGFSSHSSVHSSSSHSSFRSSSFKSSSIKSPQGLKAKNIRTTHKSTMNKNTAKTTNKTTSKGKTTSKPTSKTINNNTKVNNTIVHNHYNAPKYKTTYYTPHGSSFRSSFWDNYFMYRILTNHNTVVVNGANGTSQTIDYGYNGIWKDILTLIILIVIVVFITKRIRNRN